MPTLAKWRLKQALPTPNIARGLYRQLNIACSPGWEKGFTASTNDQACPRTPGAGQFGTQAAPIPGRGLWEVSGDASLYQVPFESYGRSIENGSVVNGSLRFGNMQTFPPILSYESPFGWSLAILWHPQTVQSADQPIVARRASPYGATNAGWSLHCAAGNTYQARVSDGATQASVTSTTTQSTTRVDLIIATYDRINLRMFVNGALEATTAATIAVGNVNRSIRVYGTGGADGTTGMLASWNRALTTSEIGSLYANPFAIWNLDEEIDADFQWSTFFSAF